MRGHEAAPIVVEQHDVRRHAVSEHRLRARSDASPAAREVEVRAESRSRRRKVSPVATSSIAACVYADGKIFFNTLDNHTIALDANTGEEMWNTKVGDINIGETMTMAPLVVKGKVLVGNSGGEIGVRGWLKALERERRKDRVARVSHRARCDVLIGPHFKPYYPKDQGKDLGVTSWPPTRGRSAAARCGDGSRTIRS